MPLALKTLRGGGREEQTPPPPGLPQAYRLPALPSATSPEVRQDVREDVTSVGSRGVGSLSVDDVDESEGLERGEWWLRAFACFFCGQWQMVKARRRERLEESEREQEAVREIARLFGKVFAMDNQLDFAAFLRGAQEGIPCQCSPACNMSYRMCVLIWFPCACPKAFRGAFTR
jgi:hypothetical protein